MNAAVAHEATHRLLNTPHGPDTDGDGVPDAWEDAIPGMDKTKKDSFGTHFTISQGSAAARDQEFYCVLGGAFRFGTVQAAGGAALAQTNYNGVVPSEPASTNDWSHLSDHWNEP